MNDKGQVPTGETSVLFWSISMKTVQVLILANVKTVISNFACCGSPIAIKSVGLDMFLLLRKSMGENPRSVLSRVT